MNAWLKGRSPREKLVFGELFESSFGPVQSWAAQNLRLMMDVLQCNIVKQMINILEGLVPVAKEEEKEAQSQHESLEGSNVLYHYSPFNH